MSVEIYGFVMPPPWGPLWLRGDAELDDDEARR